MKKRANGTPITKEFFETCVTKHDGGCWIWNRAVMSNGYGAMTVNYKTRTAHRLAYELWNGAIPSGLSILHRCDVRRCVNPKHLFIGTLIDNNNDMRSKGRGVNPPVRRGEANNRSKLTEKDVSEIRASRLSNRRLAVAYGVSGTAIRLIKKRVNWKHASDHFFQEA